MGPVMGHSMENQRVAETELGQNLHLEPDWLMVLKMEKKMENQKEMH
jgi:hypothetical protein